MGSTVLLIVLPPEDKARAISVWIVRDLPYAFILGATCLRSNNSVISLGEGKGFTPSSGAPWVPFKPHRVASKHSWDQYCAVNPTTDDPFTPSLTGRHTPLAPVPSFPMCSVGQAA